MKCLYLYLLLASGPVAAAAQENSFFSITSRGAVGDGKTLNTRAIQQTIDACAASGGGTVYVPPGVFKTGTLFLKSHLRLFLDAGAVLKGSENLRDYHAYEIQPYGKYHYGILYGDSLEDVTLAGPGTIDGNNQVFFDWNKAKQIEWGGVQFTRQKENFRKAQDGVGDGPVTPLDRPRQMVIFSRCSNVAVSDIKLLNAPFWTLHFADCDGVKVQNINLFTGMLVPNADGIDITSCNNVTISGCDIRAGDDAIAVTGYAHHFELPGYHGLKHKSGNITISNCLLQSYSSGIRIGFLDQNTVSNIQVSNTIITGSTRGIGLFVRDEGSLENISFSNMYIETVFHSGDWWGNGEPIHISAVPGTTGGKLGRIRNVRFTDIVCKGENGLLFYGSKESPLEDIWLEKVDFEFADSKQNETAGGNVDLRGCALPQQLFAREIPGILAQHVKGFTLQNVKLKWTNPRMQWLTHGLEIAQFSNVRIQNFDGNASPLNKKACRILATDGTGILVDDKRQSCFKNIR